MVTKLPPNPEPGAPKQDIHVKLSPHVLCTGGKTGAPLPHILTSLCPPRQVGVGAPKLFAGGLISPWLVFFLA